MLKPYDLCWDCIAFIHAVHHTSFGLRVPSHVKLLTTSTKGAGYTWSPRWKPKANALRKCQHTQQQMPEVSHTHRRAPPLGLYT
eukprot:1514775-Amphidinium_carterae.1